MAFRRWRQVRVRPGGTFRTARGVVAVTSVERIDRDAISEEDARHAGFATRAALLERLANHADGQLYRIGLRFAGADPRVSLRQREPRSDDEVQQIAAKLARLGARTTDGPWAVRALHLIDTHPSTRAAVLARTMGMETLRFKARIRQLKDLGLTESLDVGYRLSPRGRAVLRALSTPEVT